MTDKPNRRCSGSLAEAVNMLNAIHRYALGESGCGWVAQVEGTIPMDENQLAAPDYPQSTIQDEHGDILNDKS